MENKDLKAEINQNTENTDILIIGAGTAGLSAAIYGLRAGCTVTLIEGNVHGGQIINTSLVENYPSIAQISGFDFAQGLYEQAKNLGAKIVYQKIQEADLKSQIKTVTTNRALYQAKAVIIATGASHRNLGCKGEDKYRGRGISYCATCDGAFYRGKATMVIGGGNTALSDVLFLANICPKVYLVHRRDAFRGEKVLVDAILSKENVEVLYDSQVEEFLGEDTLKAARVKNKKSGEEKTLEIAGAFIAVGLAPQNQLFAGQINLDKDGYVEAKEECKTNLDGVWAAGDTRTKLLRQLVTAAADGAVAGSEAAAYIGRL